MRNLTVLALMVGLAACGKKPTPPAHKPGDIQITNLSFSGVAKAQAEPVFARSTEALKPCYKAGLAENENMHGEIGLTVKVSKDGDTYGVEIAEGSKAPKIHDCVKDVYRDMKVPGAGENGGTITFTVSFGD